MGIFLKLIWGGFGIGIIFLLFAYWFFPFETINLGSFSSNSNFSITGNLSKTQFYEHMRYSDKKISYRIYNCPLKKKQEMLDSFDILSNITILEFYPVEYGEEISVTCDSTAKIEEKMFIAGEGGPTNIIKTSNFNVIAHGKILLIRDSNCEKPNIALHELLHAIGFNHSENPENIMYPVTKCGQTIGEDIPLIINTLYEYPSYPDISLENVSALIHGKYLDTNISIRNNGLKNSGVSEMKIYADGKLIKSLDIDSMKIGYGTTISMTNIFIQKISIKEIKYYIEANFSELDKRNNELPLTIKK